MTFKHQYSKYSRRLSKALLRVIIFPIIYVIYHLFKDTENEGINIFFGILVALTLNMVISIFQRSKKYLTDIRLVGDCFEFEIYEYDKLKETIKVKIADTRVKISRKFFTLNSELIIEIKQGLAYRKVIRQYEIGNWTLDEFQKVLTSYRETKLKFDTTSSVRSKASLNTLDS